MTAGPSGPFEILAAYLSDQLAITLLTLLCGRASLDTVDGNDNEMFRSDLLDPG